jgi:hypothetical protein
MLGGFETMDTMHYSNASFHAWRQEIGDSRVRRSFRDTTTKGQRGLGISMTNHQVIVFTAHSANQSLLPIEIREKSPGLARTRQLGQSCFVL